MIGREMSERKLGSGTRGAGRRLAAIVGLAAMVVGACAGGQKPVQEPTGEPSLQQEDDGAAAPASSAKVQEGIDAIEGGDFADAKAILTEAQAAAPDDPQAAYYLGVACEGLGETDEALVQYRKALQLDPKLLEASVNSSAILIDAGRGEEAAEIVEAALAQAPDDANLLINHALALEALGDHVGAVKAYAKAVEKSPDNVELRFGYAENLAAAGQTDAAREQFEKVLAGTQDIQLIVGAAQGLQQTGAPERCVAVLDKVVAGDPSPHLVVRRGRCKQAARDLKGAIADYREALKRDANFAPAHYYLGVALLEQGQKAEGRKALTKAAEIGKGTPFEGMAQEALKKP